MEENKFQDLELWMIIAFYIESLGNKGIKLKDIVSNLNRQIKYKKPKYVELKYTDNKIGQLIKDDVLLMHSNVKLPYLNNEIPYVFTQRSASEWQLRIGKWEFWKKNNKDKMDLYNEFMGFINEQSTGKVSDSLVKEISGEEIIRTSNHKQITDEELNKRIEKDLKNNILHQCKENNIYLLGQLIFKRDELKHLFKYAKYCIENKRRSAKEDIVFQTALVKLIQYYSESTLNPWQIINRGCQIKYRGKTEEKRKKEEEGMKMLRATDFKQTILYYNELEILTYTI